MNLLNIYNIVKQLGAANFKIDYNNFDCFLNQENIKELNKKCFLDLKVDFWQSLKNEIKSKISKKTLENLAKDILNNEEELRLYLHDYRLKLAHLKSNSAPLNDVYKNICILIMNKILVLKSISEDLNLIIENFDCKIDSEIGNTNLNDENENDENKTGDDDKLENIIERQPINPDNPYPRIFINRKAFEMFEELCDKICVRDKCYLVDYSFVFRKLLMDGKIYKNISEREFREFLSEAPYNILIGKLKTYEYSTTELKESIYNNLGT